MTLARKGHWTTLVGLVLLGGVYVRAVVFTPVERLQGPAQKIFYLHVPAAVWTELAMVLVGVASVVFLFLKDPRLDRFAEASAEVGTVFAAIVLTTGPIWGKTVWGTWWAWRSEEHTSELQSQSNLVCRLLLEKKKKNKKKCGINSDDHNEMR